MHDPDTMRRLNEEAIRKAREERAAEPDAATLLARTERGFVRVTVPRTAQAKEDVVIVFEPID